MLETNVEMIFHLIISNSTMVQRIYRRDICVRCWKYFIIWWVDRRVQSVETQPQCFTMGWFNPRMEDKSKCPTGKINTNVLKGQHARIKMFICKNNCPTRRKNLSLDWKQQVWSCVLKVIQFRRRWTGNESRA